jgi:hypothetical protein
VEPCPWEAAQVGSLECGYISEVADGANTGTKAGFGGADSNARQCDFSRAHRLGRANAETPIVMDIFWSAGTESYFRMDGWKTLIHGKRYCVGLLNGSVQFFKDPKNIMQRSFTQTQGTMPNSAVTGYSGAYSWYDHDRWQWRPNAVSLGAVSATNPIGPSWPTVIAYIEHYMLG